jgi:lysophospholipase L1-like esterase
VGSQSIGRALGPLALALAASTLALVAAEVFVRILGPGFQVVFRESVQASENPVLEYELRPGARDGADRISREGLRDDDLVTPKPTGVLRIAAAGDSVTYGSGGPRALGWVERLEALLAESAAGAPREVWNLGVPGYNATQVLERLRRVGPALEPDVLVYGYVLNDPQAFSLEAAALARMREEAARGGPGEPGPVRRLLARSRLVLWMRHVLGAGARRPAEMPDDPAYAAAAAGDPAGYVRALHAEPGGRERVERALDDLAALSREVGAPALVAIFPLFDARRDADPLADVRGQVASAARERGLVVIDLAPVFDEAHRRLGRRLDVDFLHPNAFGHRVAAHAIRDSLCRLRVLPPEEPACAPHRFVDPVDDQLARLAADSASKLTSGPGR